MRDLRLPSPPRIYEQRDEAENRRLIELAFLRIGEAIRGGEDNDDDEDGGAGGGSDTSLAIHASPLLLGMRTQGADPIEPWPYSRPWFDATGYRWVRLVADIETAGADTATIFVEYTATPDDDDSWATPSAIGAPIAVDLRETGPKRSSGRFLLAAAARNDVVWRVRARDGNGVETPYAGHVQIQFHPGVPGDDTTPAPTMEPLYWRTGAPSVSSVILPNASVLKRSPCSLMPLHDWVSPTKAAVAAAPGRLLHTTGFSNGTLIGTTIDEQSDYWGPVGRFISPPLAAQTIPEFVSTSGCVARNQSALPSAGYVNVQLSLWRPSTDTYVARSSNFFADHWFRYVEKGRIIETYFPRTQAEAGDRWVVDVSVALENGCAFLDRTQGDGTLVYFDGPYTAIVDGDDMAGLLPASYTTTPRLRYLSEVA